MKLTAPCAIGIALLLLGAGCGGTSSSSAAEDVNSDDVYVMLTEQHGSGESGTARLVPLGRRTKVVLELTGSAATRRQAHIHAGSCDQLDPKPAYALSEVKSGTSTTTVDAKLTTLRRGSFAIDVHDLACGEIGTGRTMDYDPPGHDKE
jgi:hypothetical protein